MSAQKETGKQRAARIPLDYYKHADPLERWKMRLTGVALLATLGWLGATWAISGQDDFQSSRGPLASVHQNWDNQCQACHEPFTSISSHSAPILGDAMESSHRCQACHAGTEHHAGQTPQLSCAACHRDHRGREASLVQLPDSYCTQCHDDLKTHFSVNARAVGREHFENSVSKFASGTHPTFRSITRDPGTLEFDHRLHLTPGMALKEGTQLGGTIKTLGQIPPAQRNRYRAGQKDQRDQAPVQLQCASCHQQDAGDVSPSPSPTLGTRGSGAYMLPIRYDNHCQACHPLTIDHKPAHARLTHLEVPHGWQPAKIHNYLDDFFTASLARGLWQEEAQQKKNRPPLPGGVNEITPLPKTELDRVGEAVKSAEKFLYSGKTTCKLCHEIHRPTVRQADNIVAEPNLPQVWLTHAKFNHAAHRAVRCQECHRGAEESRSSSDVLIPDRDNCVKCHAPTTEARTPGVRSTCTTCHSYHNGAHPLQGLGASQRRPQQPRSIAEFLQGK